MQFAKYYKDLTMQNDNFKEPFYGSMTRSLAAQLLLFLEFMGLQAFSTTPMDIVFLAWKGCAAENSHLSPCE